MGEKNRAGFILLIWNWLEAEGEDHSWEQGNLCENQAKMFQLQSLIKRNFWWKVLKKNIVFILKNFHLKHSHVYVLYMYYKMLYVFKLFEDTRLINPLMH